jgi:hypothetical protein
MRALANIEPILQNLISPCTGSMPHCSRPFGGDPPSSSHLLIPAKCLVLNDRRVTKVAALLMSAARPGIATQ